MAKTAFENFLSYFKSVTSVLPEKCIVIESTKRGLPVWIVIDYVNKKTVLVRKAKSVKTDFPALDSASLNFADACVKASPRAKDAVDASLAVDIKPGKG